MAMRYYAPFPGGGIEPLRPPGPHTLRIGDAERDAAAADLGEHYAAGRLTLDELNERLDAAFSAKTFGHLATIMADLPGPGRLPWQPGPRVPGRVAHDNGWRPGGSGEPDPDRAGRIAALSLLLVAMLIWLFTALLFARHGIYHQGPYGNGPAGPFGHFAHTLQYTTAIPSSSSAP